MAVTIDEMQVDVKDANPQPAASSPGGSRVGTSICARRSQ